MKFFNNFLLKLFIRVNNLSYQQINRLSTKLNGGVHPKHEIMKYFNFFNNYIEEGSRILDVGCGIGFVSYKLAKKAKFVYGIDNNKQAIEYAVRYHSRDNIQYILGDILSHNFKEKFDYVILSNVLEHIKDRYQFLTVLKNLTKNFLIRVPMINRSWLPIYMKNLGFDYRLDSQHYIEYTLETFKEEIDKVGLIIKSYTIQFGEIWAIVKN
ncbi:MAG: class I SAM-dependent methyltransferase [Promethearchaeota archaeon]